ncbi:Transmembrane protein 135 [Frankliniella fusca]|uniref:Transmembrane protein 135 n=1 Tax=Frankliniella fusca TaxID=407009 RepID=A0AAE1LUQ3_9NEOP|nr:Transmembrane protein 135 [Frankliniella fusca]
MAVVPSRPLPPGIPSDWAEARRVFEKASAGFKCGDVIHTDVKSCPGAALDMFGGCLLGSVTYFVPFYLVHIIWNAKKALSGDKEFYADLAHFYSRSIVFGGVMGLLFSTTSCTLSRLLGGFTFWTTLCVPGMCAGLAIFVEHVYRRRIVMHTFYNLALEYLYIRAQLARLVRRTATGETAFFMAVNATLLSLLHKGSATKKKTPVFWFFMPEGENKEAKTSSPKACPVPHRHSCWRSALQVTSKYAGLAAALQALRVVMARGSGVVKSPGSFLGDYFSRKTGAGILSIGGYVARCLLASWYGSDNYQHSALAGLVAGSTYWLQPNTTILTSALIATIRLLLDYLPRQLKVLHEWPMAELLFALCNGILFHARCMDMAYCPRFIIHMMDTVTRKR